MEIAQETSLTESRPLNLSKTAKNLLSILGRATFYDVSAGLGSCGRQSENSDMVVAVNHLQMDNVLIGANPNKNPHCGRKVKIVGNTGKPVIAEIVDTCPGCSSGCLDMSSSCMLNHIILKKQRTKVNIVVLVFERVCGELSMGICPIKWDFV
ncbi:hypothetical protein A0J61_02654 [Choanephora cucurbitarum]|uniref:RlpA-like protein double-psi beta-barrel domain-containing protein n=1 Tax=Choanephora cucurbitarum TaxID=101091 RepID=A0A1C7NKH9_9FUNG|nr:hypothetical protein A0J61_02654 [Choanephora cucurbitarum]